MATAEPPQARPPTRRLVLATAAVFVTALAILIPTIGDPGLTWDEPAYRYSQVMSSQWWERWGDVRSWKGVEEQLEPANLLYHWPYGRFGINFHPPLAGQLNLAAFTAFGRWMKDIPARRMATALEFALTIAIGFHFLARRYGMTPGAMMAGSLLLMPRLFGQAHLIDTDTPGLLIWAATALAFWKGLYEPGARRWRVLVGVLLGLAFIEKMAAVMVLVPILGWLAVAGAGRALKKPSGADVIDGLVTGLAMLIPLGLAFQQIQFLQRQMPEPQDPRAVAGLFERRWASDWPGAILAAPLAVWLFRRGMGRLLPRSPLWGAERPSLEILTAILAFAPAIGWLGNPAWWRDTLPRLAHYYMLSTNRRGVLPDIQILYFGQLYEYSLPWHNAFVLMAITVPLAILGAAAVGLVWGILRVRRDRLPLYFLAHLLSLPVIRMFPTPAHDGVRLLLPAHFFLAAFAGWGTLWAADSLGRAIRLPRSTPWLRLVLGGAVLGSSAVSLARIHPYELSYYNELVGGPRGAWKKGFELTYWYDAFTNRVLDELNRRFPPQAQVDFLNEQTRTSGPVFQDQQCLGLLRGDIVLARTGPAFPYVWLLTQDSKATAFTRLLFGMNPWYANEPRQLDGARVASVYNPLAVSRAWALFVLLDAGDRSPPVPFASPNWVRRYAPWLGRFWGDGLLSELTPSGHLRARVHRLAVNRAVLDWSRSDPEGLLEAARSLAEPRPKKANDGARRLYGLITDESGPNGSQVRPELAERLFADRHSRTALNNRALIRHELARQLFASRPEALVEAVRILNAHRDEVVAIMTRFAYTDPISLGGYLDRDLPSREEKGTTDNHR